MRHGDHVASVMGRLVAQAATQAIARAQEYRIPQDNTPLPNNFDERSQARHIDFVGIVPVLQRAFSVLASGMVLLASSVALYGLFYILYMPAHQVSEPLFFDYTGLVKHPSPVCMNNSPTTAEDYAKLENFTLPWQPTPVQLKFAPWAAVDLFAKHTQWEAFQSEVIPKPIAKKSILKAGRAHYLEVALSLPESEINVRAGMFGVYVQLQSCNGTKLAFSMRATRLPYESPYIALARKVIFLVPILMGAVQESKTVVVPSFRHVVECWEQPLVSVSKHVLGEMCSWNSTETSREPILF
jgi:Putative adipose-regulatory protein (Seipin)